MNVVNILRTKVKNLKGTSDRKCQCDSWLAHWEKFSGNNSNQCAVVGCSHDAEVGAHVVKCDSPNGEHYIVPMCKGHNVAEDSSITVEKELINANVNKTCGASPLTSL